METTETIDITWDFCLRWNFKVFDLNPPYRILLLWIGAIKNQAKKTVDKYHIHTFALLHQWRYFMLCWHSILRLQTEGNFVEHYPVVWSFRKRSQASGSKGSLEKVLLPTLIKVLQSIVALDAQSYWEHSVVSDDFLLADLRWNTKLGTVPTPILKTHVTVIYGIGPNVLDYKACLE